MMVKKMPMGELFEEQYKFAEPFNALQLNDCEIALMSAIMIFNPGNLYVVYLVFKVNYYYLFIYIDGSERKGCISNFFKCFELKMLPYVIFNSIGLKKIFIFATIFEIQRVQKRDFFILD